MERQLDIHTRETGKKSILKKLRSQNKVPAVIYGEGFKSCSIWVDGKEISNIVAKEKTSVLNLVEGKKKVAVIIKDVSYDNLTDVIDHVDFLKIEAKKEIDIKVPVEASGSSPGVKAGGILDFVTREIEIRTIPAKIPSHLNVDISSLEIGHSLKVEDVEIPEGINVLTAADTICISVQAPRKEEEIAAPVPEGEEEEGAVEETEKTGEPEVLRQSKEDKDAGSPDKGQADKK